MTPNVLEVQGGGADDDADFDYLELVNEAQMEEALEKLNLRLESIKPNFQTMKIGESLQIPFNERDPIFALAEPYPNQTKTPECATCKTFVFKKDKQIIYCQFCGFSNCKDCALKDRPFPNGNPDARGKLPRGPVCKLCDRKFFVKQLTEETSLVSRKEMKKIKKLTQ